MVLTPALFSPMTMLIAAINGKYSQRIWSELTFGNRSIGGQVTENRLCGERMKVSVLFRWCAVKQHCRVIYV
ncbi:hypothetical protein EHS86_13525 [Erwinia amylovora]|uniref:Uncharacterized protein n=2 Tax=Erwinia amylovora TaxID=552 RepID=A0A831A2A4_ERWAM|nr:hypothetical protein AD997_06500 [Erwinia amylovora]EKV53979.1 hypothetical protein EaACW_1279 [Erwinia amylovora ACW56400]CBA20219.1 hypothetical protein predicted by Glimmer/Critica [Erwinia amylovora CFBP1430]CCO78126.1 hypothetical protein BN432_1316 [Erwinia amylovora Ea356]CCO81912.1 hypothetical protein BN433_1328 [Erwinia amylovora Ea266]CCO85711.1 hypothetical protein BN434_1311 [Erwinia amylovora CFBP 2585]CCO89497.1 hypothetical protein BN435_1313 [Erwinia amylovora 01SFR-BO]CC